MIEKVCLLKAWYDEGRTWDEMPRYMQQMLQPAYGILFREIRYFETIPYWARIVVDAEIDDEIYDEPELGR